MPAGNQIELECDGSIVDKAITFSGPVTDQLVSLSVIPSGDDSELSFVIDDNKQTASLTINWSPSTAGTIQLEITATDSDSTDPKTTVISILFTLAHATLPQSHFAETLMISKPPLIVLLHHPNQN